MARLETQINQIFLSDPLRKKTEVILYEEKLNHLSQLFFIAAISDLPKKTGQADLKRISEIIIGTFKSNKKLSKDALFESSLAEINQGLADFAHGGRRLWLGKLSVLAAIQSGEDIFLANSGQTSAWLKRPASTRSPRFARTKLDRRGEAGRNQIFEILPPEKRGLHPMKIFTNFTSGKVTESDALILTTSNLFNYVSPQLFKTFLAEKSLEQAAASLSEIIKQSDYQQEGFASFLLEVRPKNELEPMVETETIYAPLNEEPFPKPKLWHKLPKLPRLPRFRLGKFSQMSRARKFFLGSFLVFVLLFGLNLIVFAFQLGNKKHQSKVNAQYELFATDINQIESALIYKNDVDAVKYLGLAQAEFEKLKKLDSKKAAEASVQLLAAADKVNRVSVVENPKLITTLSYSPTFLARAGNGFIFASSDPKTISTFDGANLKSLLLLNSVEGEIRGLVHAQNNGNLATGKNTVYRINQANGLFEPIKQVPNANLTSLRFLPSSRVYTLDKASNQVLRLTLSGNSVTSQSLLRAPLELQNAQDVGIDSDIYILFPDHVIKAVNGNPQEFKLTIADGIGHANRIFVGSSIYILESGKKRLLIFGKNGKLLNQIFFPNMNAVKDLYVDENQRVIYLLDENKLWQITF